MSDELITQLIISAQGCTSGGLLTQSKAAHAEGSKYTLKVKRLLSAVPGILQVLAYIPIFNHMISDTYASRTPQVFKLTKFSGGCRTSVQEDCWYIPD